MENSKRGWAIINLGKVQLIFVRYLFDGYPNDDLVEVWDGVGNAQIRMEYLHTIHENFKESVRAWDEQARKINEEVETYSKYMEWVYTNPRPYAEELGFIHSSFLNAEEVNFYVVDQPINSYRWGNLDGEQSGEADVRQYHGRRAGNSQTPFVSNDGGPNDRGDNEGVPDREARA